MKGSAAYLNLNLYSNHVSSNVPDLIIIEYTHLCLLTCQCVLSHFDQHVRCHLSPTDRALVYLWLIPHQCSLTSYLCTITTYAQVPAWKYDGVFQSIVAYNTFLPIIHLNIYIFHTIGPPWWTGNLYHYHYSRKCHWYRRGNPYIYTAVCKPSKRVSQNFLNYKELV